MKSRSGPIRYASSAVAAATWLLLGAAPVSASERLELVPEVEILVALLLLFAAIVVPVNRLIFKPIFQVLDARDANIAGTRERARSLAGESQQLLSRYDEALREVRAEVSEDRKQTVEAARSESGSRLGQARGEAEGEIERARRELAEAVTEARHSLRAQTETLAHEAATRVLGRAIS